MSKRYVLGFGIFGLAILLTLVVWQVSFKFGDYTPADAGQTFAFWAISTLIFILTVALGARLFRICVKLYLERQTGREGSRIQSKLVFGALALSLLPVVFLVAFGWVILNRTLTKWFSRPAENIKIELTDTSIALGEEVQGRAQALANWLASQPEANVSADLCTANRIAELSIENGTGGTRVLCQDAEAAPPGQPAGAG